MLVNGTFRLEKMPGKGGWTYVALPEVAPDPHAHFGWVRVNGSIDGFEIKRYHLMPMGNGCLFLPVKAMIRKAIKKQAGDEVHVLLYADTSPLEIPDELLLCLKDVPEAYDNFFKMTASQQKAYIDWIYSAKRDETLVERISVAINRISLGRLHGGK